MKGVQYHTSTFKTSTLSFDVMNFQTISKLKNSNLLVNMYANMCKCTDRTFR